MPETDVYSANFFETLSGYTRESAQILVPMIRDLVRPASVLDVGCGVGTWLDEWGKAGVTELLGVDGHYVDKATLQIPAGSFTTADLNKPFSLDRTFDLVQTLEVAEHLDEANADAFVESLARHGDTILFSAAIPGQGGEHHVNEQWPSYWVEKFAKAGYTAYDAIRPQIWTDQRISMFYRQNLLIFARNRVFEGSTAPLDLVHPDMWQNPWHVMHNVPGALKTMLARRLGSN